MTDVYREQRSASELRHASCLAIAARDLAIPMRDERPWRVAAVGRHPGCMEEPEAAPGWQAGDDIAAPARRFIVTVGKPAGEGSADRIEEPDRLLRVWSLLEATYEQMDWAALPSKGVPGLERQFQAIRCELEQAVSPSLAAELRRILPSGNAAPSVGALRIQYAVLLSWSGSLMVEMLRELAAAHERLRQPKAAA